MSVLLLILLALPVMAVAVIVGAPARAQAVLRPVAGLIAGGWVVLAAADEPVSLGDLIADPLLAAATVGLAVTVAALGARTPVGTAAALLTLSVFPAAAAFDPARLPDRRLAAGAVVVAVLAVVRLGAERAPRLGRVLVVLSGLVLASGLIGDDPGESVALAVAGTVVAVVAAAVWVTPGRLLVPVGLLAVARVAPLRATPAGTDWVLLVIVALVLVGAVVLLVVRARPVVARLPLGVALAAAALGAFDVAELRSAGALLGAGAVLALAGSHAVALVAVLPGLAAAVDAAGLASQPEHAAVGAAIVAVLVAGSIDVGATAPVRAPSGAPSGLLSGVVVAFAVVPLWGWSGADLEDYRRALAVALAVGIPVLVLTLPVWRDHLHAPTWRRAATGPAPASPRPRVPDPDDVVAALTSPARPAVRVRRRGSRIVARPSGVPSHGTALQDAESDPEAHHGQAGDGPPS